MKKHSPADGGSADGGSAESTPTILLVACYNLTDEALEKAARPGITKRQYVAVTLDKDEAIRTGYARKIWSSDEDTSSSATYHTTDFILCKLEPNLAELGVTRGPVLPEFDHILSGVEAAEMIEKEMARYDEVLAVSRAAYDKRANGNTIMVTLTGYYYLTVEAHRELYLAGTLPTAGPTAQEQCIDVTVSAREALRTGYLSLTECGIAYPSVNGHQLFSRLTPNFEFVGVLRKTIEAQQFDHVLTTEEATNLVIGEMARYDGVLAESKAKIEADQKLQKEKEAKEKEERRKEIEHFLIDLDYYTPRIKRGEACVIDTERTDPEWFEMEGERVVLRYDLANANPESTWDTERAKATSEFFREEREKRINALITAWVEEHASVRLKKALKVGILKNLMRTYHLERLALELPGWDCLKQGTMVREDPAESEIDALILAREKWPEGNVEIRLVPLCHVARIPMMAEDTKWGPALVMRCPWNKNHVVKLDLDQKIRSEVEEPPKEAEGDSRRELHENLPAGSILLWNRMGVPVRVLHMKGFDASCECTLRNGQPEQEISHFSGPLPKRHFRLITAENYPARDV